ncbi:helix-turn-helix transcriptional regulator [Chitinophaga arvensicola]|uniref:Predicted transcriptional regulator, ArsR family n=1 Tax=Chitinophaga arvensicola TaxID=29529 RepID=A0A1I0RV48_9BACT|nr:metalloregulator ArsR/SmtB family transcription factor [Chitinophaga arvensicola]SEW45259.1 Predicted transcriptional regulator, ArsR family [Chitinophaga arvensicola]
MMGENEKALLILKRNGPMPLIALAKELGLSTEGARFHLIKLANEGLVVASTEVKGRGRPQQVWALAPAGHSRFPDAHAEISVKLINKVRTLFGEEGLKSVIAANAEESKERYLKNIGDDNELESRVRKLAALRDQEGYMARYEKAGESYLLIEDHCPICTAATACQGFCKAELNIFREVLDAKVNRVEHVLNDGRRCTYKVEPK